MYLLADVCENLYESLDGDDDDDDDVIAQTSTTVRTRPKKKVEKRANAKSLPR